MRHITIGTAGHVDHGKTALIKRLTGIDLDRLPEEKRRGMTIEPGFAGLVLPNGQHLGIIDVPGHWHFLKNMLSGIMGVDLALLVVAADEGIMPQTREHLLLLQLLGIDKGVVALTKADLVQKEDLEEKGRQLRELLCPTSLKAAPLVACSALTGEGIWELKKAISAVADTVQPRPANAMFRLPVDRVFAKPGFGTIAAGTLWEGRLRVGDAVELWPFGKQARVRGIQIHGAPAKESIAGARTAVNLSGVAIADLPHGSWLAAPGLLKSSTWLDVQLILPQGEAVLKHRANLHVHYGAMEVLAKVRLLDREELCPGADCSGQLQLAGPLAPLVGDKLILRGDTLPRILAAAVVTGAQAHRRRRYCADTPHFQYIPGNGIKAKALAVLRNSARPCSLAQLAQQTGESEQELKRAIQGLGQIVTLNVDAKPYYWDKQKAASLFATVQRGLEAYHKRYPLRAGCPAAELHTRFLRYYPHQQAMALLEYWKEHARLCCAQAEIFLPSHTPCLTARQQKWVGQILAAYRLGGFQPPGWSELAAKLGLKREEAEEIRRYLCKRGDLVRCKSLLFSKEVLQEGVFQLREQYGKAGFTPAQARDLLGGSRRYMIPLLEYLDEEGITQRVAEKRIFCPDP